MSVYGLITLDCLEGICIRPSSSRARLPISSLLHPSTFLPKMPAPAFLHSLIPHNAPTPFITLTYAQSLDAKIAGPGRRQIQLSGEESMLMTHWCVVSSFSGDGC